MVYFIWYLFLLIRSTHHSVTDVTRVKFIILLFCCLFAVQLLFISANQVNSAWPSPVSGDNEYQQKLGHKEAHHLMHYPWSSSVNWYLAES